MTVEPEGDKLTYEPSPHPASVIFSGETLESLGELGDVLKRIHDRLTDEGYVIVNGKIEKLNIIKF